MARRRAFWIVVFLACTMAIGAVAAIYTGDASVTVGHVIIAVVLGAFATGVLAILWVRCERDNRNRPGRAANAAMMTGNDQWI